MIGRTNEKNNNDKKEKEMEEVKRITRDVLRKMRDGDVLTVDCKNGYDMDSQKNIAYGMQKMERCKFACKANGMRLTVMRFDCDRRRPVMFGCETVTRQED